MMTLMAYAIVRPDGHIQLCRDAWASAQPEVYTQESDARFIRDKAYPGLSVIAVAIVSAEKDQTS